MKITFDNELYRVLMKDAQNQDASIASTIIKALRQHYKIGSHEEVPHDNTECTEQQ